MNFSAPFIRRPVATVLLAVGLLLIGLTAVRFLPVAALPSVDIPTIVVFAGRPGADPQTMAASIAAPLERRLGEIPGVSELTSTTCRRRSTRRPRTCRRTCRRGPTTGSSTRRSFRC